MHFTDLSQSITLSTPCPPPPTEEDKQKRKAKKSIRIVIESEDELVDDEGTPIVSHVTTSVGPPPVIPVSLPPRALFSEATTTSVPDIPGPSSPITPHPTPRARRNEVMNILPILSVEPTRRITVQTLLPLLQDTFLGLMNHMIQVQNQSNESLHRSLGLQPPAPIPTYPHPYHSASPASHHVRFADPPVVPSSAPSTEPLSTPFSRDELIIIPPVIPTSLSTPFITTEAFLRALDPSISGPSFAAVSEIISDIATSSGIQHDVEDEPILIDTPIVSSSLPVPSVSEESDSATEEVVMEVAVSSTPVSTAEPTTTIVSVPTSAPDQSTGPDTTQG